MTDGLEQWGREADVSKPEPIPELRNFGVWTPDGLRDVTSAFRQYQAMMEKLERMAVGDRPRWLVEIDRFYRIQLGGADPIHMWLTIPLMYFEPPQSCVRRFWRGFHRLIAESPDTRIIAATHSGPIRAFATWAHGYDPGEPYNTEEVVVKMRRGGGTALVAYRNRVTEVNVPPPDELPVWDDCSARAHGSRRASCRARRILAGPRPLPALASRSRLWNLQSLTALRSGRSRSRWPCWAASRPTASWAPPTWPASSGCQEHRLPDAVGAGHERLLDGRGGRYRLGLRMFETRRAAADRMPVRDAAQPVLIELQQQLREMVQLGVPVAGHVAYIDRYGHAALGLQLSGEVLHRVPGYSSSSGRALAAFDDRDHGRHPGRAPPQAHAVHDHRPGPAAPGCSRPRGPRAGSAPGRSSPAASPRSRLPCSSAAIRLAAISVAGPTGRILGLRRDFIVASVCRAAQRVSTLIGDC